MFPSMRIMHLLATFTSALASSSHTESIGRLDHEENTTCIVSDFSSSFLHYFDREKKTEEVKPCKPLLTRPPSAPFTVASPVHHFSPTICTIHSC